MGRSRGAFLLPAAPAHIVLGRAAQWGAFEQMAPASSEPGKLVLTRGNENAGGRRWFVVSAVDTPQGAQVGVEVWTQVAAKELNADARGFMADPNKRAAWNEVMRLLTHLGAGGATAAIRHE